MVYRSSKTRARAAKRGRHDYHVFQQEKFAEREFATFVAQASRFPSASCVVNDLSDLSNVEDDVLRFKAEYLQKEILSKYFDPSHYDDAAAHAAAIEKFAQSGDLCRYVNSQGISPDFTPAHVHYARAFIAKVLGPLRHSILLKGVFTTGATTSRRRKYGDPFFKYSEHVPVHVTPRAYRYAKAVIESNPVWAGLSPPIKQVAGNRVITIEKKVTAKRVIACEPDLNLFLQKAVGTFMKKRLRHAGINLYDQSVNRRLACVGSSTGLLATLDLSSASDTVSQRIVWELLPDDWFALLDDLRSHYGTMPDGSLVKWDMFSSMGNAFTFELETLIFAAISYSVYRVNGRYPQFGSDLSLFGDDIICRSDLAGQLITALESCGFLINKDKSFVDGPFRESCGGHFYLGHEVTPFYIRRAINTPDRVIWFLNRLRLWSVDSRFGVCDPRVYPKWLSYRRKFCPPSFSGGSNIESLSEVFEPARNLLRLTKSRQVCRLNGWPAVLRSFQNRNLEDITFTSVSVWGKSGSELVHTPAPELIEVPVSADGCSVAVGPYGLLKLDLLFTQEIDRACAL